MISNQGLDYSGYSLSVQEEDMGQRKLRRPKPKLLERAWPGGFQQGAKGGRPAGAKYSVVGNGLFEDFRIVPVKIGD
jgi:hypothetical protein